MSKKSHKALASATVMSLILTSTLTATVSAATGVERLSGSNRETTAIDVATKVFEKAETVVLVNGYKSADALSATPLAKAYNAPILSVGAVDEPTAALLASLKDLGAKKVVVVGGEGAVTKALAAKLAETYTVERIEGKDRYATNVNVAKKVMELKASKEAFVVNGSDASYADALSIASIAASKGAPIVFTNGKTVSEDAKALVKDLKVAAIGGTGVVSADVLAAVNATRVGGADRFETNLEVLKAYKDVIKLDNVFVAYGLNFADALVASAAAAKTDAPVVLADKTNTKFTKGATDYIEANKAAIKNVYLVGGTGVIADSVKNSIDAIVNPVATELVAEAVNVLDLTQFEVKFSKEVDKTTATNPANYVLKQGSNAKTIDVNTKLTLKEDGKTVLVTLTGANASETLSNQLVHKLTINNVRSKNKSEKLVDVVKEFTPVDMVAPTVEKVEVQGLRTIKVYFSENVTTSSVTSNSNYKLDGKSLSGFAAGSISYDSETNTAIIPFGIDLTEGTHELTISASSNIVDYAGLRLVEAKKTVDVVNDTTTPAVKNVELVKNPGFGLVNGDYVKVSFTKPLASDGLVYQGTRYDNLTAASAANLITIDGKQYQAWIKDGSIFASADSDLKAAGTHVVRMFLKGTSTTTTSDDHYIVDAWGVKVPDNTTATYSTIADITAPVLNSVEVKNSKEVDVVFSEDVTLATAETKLNYVLKNSKNEIVSIARVKHNPESLGDNYVRLTTTDELKAGTYSLTIKDVKDEAGNKLAEVTKTVVVEDVVAPKLSTATVSTDGLTVYVTFSEAIKTSTLTDKASYNINGKALPTLTSITATQDNKVAKIVLPSNHTLGTVSGGKVSVSGIIDENGNKMEGLYQEVTVAGVGNIAVATFTDGETVQVTGVREAKIKLNKELAELDVNNFGVTLDGGTTWIAPLATSTFENKDGKATVTLKFNKDLVSATDKTDLNLGTLQFRVVTAQNTKALDDAKFAAGATFTNAQILDKIAPEIDSVASSVSSNKLVLTVDFTEAVSASHNDFVIINNGETIAVDGAKVVGANVDSDTITLTVADVTDSATEIDFSQRIYVATKSVVVSADLKANKVKVDTEGVKVDSLETAMTDTKAIAVVDILEAVDKVGAEVKVKTGATNPITTSYLATGEKLGVIARIVPGTGSATAAATKLVDIDSTAVADSIIATFGNTAVLNAGDKIQVKIVDLAGGYDSGWTTLLTK